MTNTIDPHKFLAWLQTKPAIEEYEYTSNENCPVAQFIKETGLHPAPIVLPGGWFETQADRNADDGVDFVNGHRFDSIIDNALNGEFDRTYGDAASSLKHLLEQRS